MCLEYYPKDLGCDGREENSDDLLVYIWPSEDGCDNSPSGKVR